MRLGVATLAQEVVEANVKLHLLVCLPFLTDLGKCVCKLRFSFTLHTAIASQVVDLLLTVP